MKPNKVGLVGIGRLGKALLTHWEKHHIKIGVYHPSESKLKPFLQQFSNSYRVTEIELLELDMLILALPAATVIPFIANLYSNNKSPSIPPIINMATALETKDVKAKFPDLNVHGVKYMGHAKDLEEHGKGLFITETPLPHHIENLYQYLGQIKIDQERELLEVNQLATFYAIKAALEIESEFAKKGLSPDYVKRALTSLAPEVIRGYCEGTLGHFAKEIVNEIKGNTQTPNH